jgi:hypothetical protein
MGSLCISLTSPATLEHLKFNISFRGYNIDIINVDEEWFYENLRDADAWSYLDSITSHPTGSRLQRVDINIVYSFLYDDGVELERPDENKVSNAILDGLPLLRSKGILFVEAAAK